MTTEDAPLQHTFGHIDCPACEATRNDTLGHDPDSLLSKKFSVAAPIWLESRRQYLKARSFYMAEHHIKQLNKSIGEIPIEKMHIGHLRHHQIARINNEGGRWKRPAGPSIINHELSVVQMVLKRAGVWKQRFQSFYEPLPKPPTRPLKVMTDREEQTFFQIGAVHPDWELAYIAAGITANTSAAGTELRHLRLENLFLDNAYPTFFIPPEFCKNDHRGRRIFINGTCMHLFKMAVAWANRHGSVRPDHCLFPKRIRTGVYDPTSPASASWLRKQFNAWREAAGVPWLTPHCLRHQIITKLFEEGNSEQDVQSITGQLSRASLRIYSHNRIERQASVLATIDPAKRKPVQTSRIGASRAWG